MSFKDQLNTLKNNWLLIVIVLIILVFFSGAGDFMSYSGGYETGGMVDYAMPESMGMPAPSMYRGEDFAPEVEERKITKTASLNTEVEKDTFNDAVTKLKSITKSSDSFILNENINKHGKEKTAYFTGYFELKVDTKKYDAVVAQLKDIGEVTSFNENTADITGRYTNLKIELETEKERLKRYQSMYKEAEIMEDKINLNDRIFNQEIRIKYMEDSLANLDKRVDYTTITVNIKEKRNAYATVVLVKFSDLIEGLVDSFNALISFIFVILPWAIAIAIIAFLVKRKKKR